MGLDLKEYTLSDYTFPLVTIALAGMYDSYGRDGGKDAFTHKKHIFSYGGLYVNNRYNSDKYLSFEN